MIRFIAAIDEKNGLADEHGIPWHGKIPTDVRYYHDKLKTGTILIGYGVYKELTKPFEGSINYVAVRDKDIKVGKGFEVVHDARAFLRNAKNDVWNAGGALLFASTLDLADELYLTRLQGDFHCTKFFPKFEQDFKLVAKSEPLTENGITYHFEIWARK